MYFVISLLYCSYVRFCKVQKPPRFLVFYSNLNILFYVTFCVFKLNVRFYLLCIHVDIFMHCALYVFYEANKDDYY